MKVKWQLQIDRYKMASNTIEKMKYTTNDSRIHAADQSIDSLPIR